MYCTLYSVCFVCNDTFDWGEEECIIDGGRS